MNHLLASQASPRHSQFQPPAENQEAARMNGREYYFISAGEFRKRIDAGEFIEWEEVYRDHYYGTLRSEIEQYHKSRHDTPF
ncbi:MAG: hypothetical protein MZV63_05755 [Marinilabiliales bacterium]|nr:hypothetical protein [Marinilabiliales bacterium]